MNSGGYNNEAQYCPKCKRILGIGCVCDMNFKDRIKQVRTNWVTWSDTRKKNDA
jgi:hypothetical protein